MAASPSTLPAADLARYQATARARAAARQAELAEHHACALGVARAAADILRREFGATAVTLFGSLARGGPVSWRTDVDLAASGVRADRYFAAVGRLQAIDPGVSVDLVRIEEASGALMAVIDAEGGAAVTGYPALATRIRLEITDLKHSVDRVASLADKATRSGDPDYLDGVALNLQAFYTGVEHVLEAIAREVDEAVPSGPEWHRDLLLQMSGAIGGLRPPVLREETRTCLDEYRGFRHVSGHNLDPRRLRELADALPGCYADVILDLSAFAGSLDALLQRG